MQEQAMSLIFPTLRTVTLHTHHQGPGKAFRLGRALKAAQAHLPKILLNLFLAACLGLTACSSVGDMKPLPDVKPTGYLLGVGDKVRIITFGSEPLTGEFRINDAGNVALPLLGTVPAAGMTPDKLQTAIARDLESKNLFHNPNVSVEITEYRPIFILGEVNRPGEYPYKPGMTVLSAVSTAGGFTYRAVTDTGSVVRTTDGVPEEGTVNRRSLILPGDVITIFERHF
jgi:polysaccharide export outer membrane protein